VDKHKLKRALVSNPTLKRLVYSVFLIIILAYLGIFFYSYFYAEKIIFQPQPSSYRDTNQIIKLDSGDGVKISAIYLPNPDAPYTILYSHGNAEDIGQLLPTLEDIKRMGFSVFAYDYRGYGTSAGTSSEENAYRDEDAAYDYLVNNLGVPAKRIIALGRSLGGAVAVDLAHRRELGGLIIESSFVTAYRVLTGIPLFPFDKFKSISKIKEVRCPVLVIHGKNDEVIAFWHGEKLFQEANEPKLSYWVEGAGHNNLFEVAGDRYGQVLRYFVALIEKNS
jgi:abhydrolase domain-containing protein 17